MSTRLTRPSSIAIDFYMGDRVYWSDSKENRIESMRPDGTDRVVVLAEGEESLFVRSVGVTFCRFPWRGTTDIENKASSAENPELLKIPSFKPRIGQNIASHALPTGRNSVFLISTFLAHSTSFKKNLTESNMCHEQ